MISLQRVSLPSKALADLPKYDEHIQVQKLIIDLKYGDIRTRRQAAISIGRYGKEASHAIDGLIEALRDEDELVQTKSIDALLEIIQEHGDKNGKAIEAFVKILNDRNSLGFDLVLEIFADDYLEEEEAVSAIPVLIHLLKDNDSKVRYSAAKALGDIGEKAAASIPALIQALDDEDYDVRDAVRYLGLVKIAEKSNVAIAFLKQAYNCEDINLHRTIREMLLYIEDIKRSYSVF